MSANTAYAMNAYRRTSTALPPIEATVFVCDEIINSLMKADRTLADKQYGAAFEHTQRATTLCRGMQLALNYEAGEDVAKQLDKYYNSFILAALRTVGQPDASERYRRLAEGMLNLRNSWAEVGNLPLRKLPPLPAAETPAAPQQTATV